MTGALVMLAISGALVMAAPRVLARLTESGRRPILGVVAWQLTSWSVLLGLVVAAAFVVKPSLEKYVEFPVSLHSCFEALGRMTGRPHAHWLQAVAAAVVVAMLARLSACAAANVSATRRRRSRHRMLLGMVGRRDSTLDAHVVTGDLPVVYCVPGRGGCVVFTSAALDRLTPEQRRAVLAHEKAHLRGRHHLLVGSAALLSGSFPKVALFVQARDQTARLVEMRADDVAARRHGARAVAEALLSLADVANPAGVLGATGVGTAARIERLVMPAARRVQAATADVALVLGVLVLALSPLLLAVSGHALICQL